MPTMEAPLAYIDHASFLALRALGRGPRIQYLWIVPGRVDPAAARRLNVSLASTLLGRRIRKSLLPFGRHRWIWSDDPGVLTFEDTPIEPTGLMSWAHRQSLRPVDPETGPNWQLAVQPLSNGDTAIALCMSHSTVDGIAASEAVCDAILQRSQPNREASRRSSRRLSAISREFSDVACSVPDALRAIAAARRTLRPSPAQRTQLSDRPAMPPRLDPHQIVEVPTCILALDEGQLRGRAESAGASVTALLAGFAAHLGSLLGRVDQQGQVNVVIPISRRLEGDTRANALSVLDIHVQTPVTVGDLSKIRAQIKTGITDLTAREADFTAALALAPYIPRGIARRLESHTLRGTNTVSSSHVGTVPEAVNRPMGTEASLYSGGLAEATTPAILNHYGGTLNVVTSTLAGRTSIRIRAWQPGIVTTRADLLPFARQALSDFGLVADTI